MFAGARRPGPASACSASYHLWPMSPRAVVVSSYTPTVESGRGRRTYGLVRALAAAGPVDFVHTRFGAPAPSSQYRDLPGLTLHPVARSRGPRRALAFLRARAAGAPTPIARGVSGELARVADRVAEGADQLIADDPMAAVALAGVARRRPVIYSAHNLESAFRLDWGPRDRLEDFERRLIERSVETWMPSAADLAGAARLAPTARLRLVPNVVDVAAVEPVNGLPRAEPVALLVADFLYPPNREGLGFLLDEVMPRAWARAPTLRLHVVGRALDPPPPADPRVRFLGFVDDLEAAYAVASCAVVPLLSGGGSPLKFIEALAHGLPVVATPKAAAGLEVVAGEHYLEGDGPESFAAALAAALDPALAARLGAAGRALVERKYSIAALTAQFTS
jgi:glycosyltransferase involved in cell wall biosynthesis